MDGSSAVKSGSTGPESAATGELRGETALDGQDYVPGQAEPPIARVSGVTRRYGSVVALDRLNLEIRCGETLGLLGPNGAGKSTLLSLLSGIASPDSGTIDIAGEGTPTRAAVRRRIGFAPQALALYPKLTAAENLRFFARLHGVPGNALGERVRYGLEVARLAERADDRVGTFSGGMQRRLNLACAALHGPRLLLLDEPTAGVDAQSRQHLSASMARLRGDGATLVISTHLLDEAERLCDRVAILDRGQLRASATPRELKAQHGAPDLQAVMLELTGRELQD